MRGALRAHAALRVPACGARLLGLVLQALEEGGQRKAEAAVAHVGRQVRRQAQPLDRHLRQQAASGGMT